MIYVLTPFSEGSVYVTVVTPELHSSGHLLSVCWRRVVTLLVTLLISPLCVSRQPIIQFIICGTRLCHDWLLSAAEFRSALSCSHGTLITIQRLLSPLNETFFYSRIYISPVILQILLLVLFNIIVLQSQISIQFLNVHDMDYANKK